MNICYPYWPTIGMIVTALIAGYFCGAVSWPDVKRCLFGPVDRRKPDLLRVVTMRPRKQ